MDSDPNSLPLRERIRNAEKLVRELAEQLESGYLTRVRELKEKTSDDAAPIGDMTIRMSVARLMALDDEVDAQWKKTRRYLKSIQSEVDRVLGEGD